MAVPSTAKRAAVLALYAAVWASLTASSSAIVAPPCPLGADCSTTLQSGTDPVQPPAVSQPSAPACAGPVCEDQGDPRTSCWQCLGYNAAESTIVLDVTNCGWESVCCLTAGCQASPLTQTEAAAFGKGRSLLQSHSAKYYKFKFQASSQQLQIQAGSSIQSSRQGKRRLFNAQPGIDADDNSYVLSTSGHTLDGRGPGVQLRKVASYDDRTVAVGGKDGHRHTYVPSSPVPQPTYVSNTQWTYCRKKGHGCCAAGPSTACSDHHVCTITIDFKSTEVCKPAAPKKPTAPKAPACPSGFCEDQSTNTTSCYTCLGYNSRESSIVINATKCNWQDVCCLTPGCKVTLLSDTQAKGFVNSGRSLLQPAKNYKFTFPKDARSLTVQTACSTQSSKQSASNKRRSLLPASTRLLRQADASGSHPDIPAPIWQTCTELSASCCVVGPMGACSDGHVCTFHINFQESGVCCHVR